MADTTKRCWKCGETRPIERFELRRDTGRRREVCRSCVTKQQKLAAERKGVNYNRRSYWANRDKRLADNKAWRDANKAYTAAHNRAWREAHADEMREYIRAWRKENGPRLALYGAKRRALIKERAIEVVDRFSLYRRRKGICGICKRRVSIKRFAVDHIVPLARGGEHSYRNTQLAHPSCNSRKRDRFPWEMTA